MVDAGDAPANQLVVLVTKIYNYGLSGTDRGGRIAATARHKK